MTILQMDDAEERQFREFVTEIRNNMEPFKPQEVVIIYHKARVDNGLEVYKIQTKIPNLNLIASFDIPRETIDRAVDMDVLAFIIGKEFSRQFRNWQTAPEENVILGEN